MRDKKDILMRAERTPNPLALKLVLNVQVKRKGAATFSTKESAGPFFGKLFAMPDLARLYVFENQITLTFKNEPLLEEIEKRAEALVKENWGLHDPDFKGEEVAAAAQKKAKKAASSPLIQQIEEILDRTIRPGLQADGGDIEVVSLNGNKLEISYQGACGGCPSSYMGTLEAIENILRYELKNEELWLCPTA